MIFAVPGRNTRRALPCKNIKGTNRNAAYALYYDSSYPGLRPGPFIVRYQLLLDIES